MVEKSRIPESQGERAPFIIRAHHASSFVKLFYKGFNPADISYGIRSSVEEVRVYPPKGFAEKIDFKRKLKYAQDVLGNTIEEADRVEQSIKKFMEYFLALPDDYPVKLVDRQKDGMCNSCIVGEHCTEKRKKSGDKIFIEQFAKTAKRLGLESDTQKVEDIATYSNAEPETVVGILTTAGTAKSVFSDARFAKKLVYKSPWRL